MPAGAEPAKHAPVRRGYDFTRPEPGDILPNPAEGVGPPPRLRAYVTVKDMAAKTATAETATAETEAARGAAEAAPAASDAPPVSGAGPDAGGPAAAGATAPPSPDVWRSAPTAVTARHIETMLARQIVAQGLDGTFAYEPSPAARADPAVKASEKRVWDRVVASLGVSWAAWKAAHAAPQGAGTVVTSAPSAMSRDTHAATPVPPEIAPGRIILRGAPGTVTGDLTDVAP